MKVIEKGVDRTAYVHVFVHGRVHPLEEYGQYVDARDGAICCYIAVEEDHKIRIDGRFKGTTLAVAYDFTVDGVCRKANSYLGKSVQVQQKRLDVESFLYQTPDGIIDTDMSVTPRTGPVLLSKDAPETIGTMELRVYVTRQFGIEHEIDDIRIFDKLEDEEDTGTRVASYKDVPPQFHMVFEKNCSIMEGSKSNREKRKVYGKRPGNKPWTIFRFHYRTKESILDSKMEISFDAPSKTITKQEAHELELEPVPVLLLGTKPAGKNEGDSSVRTSSPAPPDTPSTPIKGTKKAQSTQPKVAIKKTQAKPTTAVKDSTPDMAAVTDADATKITEPSKSVVRKNSTSNAHPLGSTQVKDDSSIAAVVKNATDDEPDIEIAKELAVKSVPALGALLPKKPTKKTAKKHPTFADTIAESKSRDRVKNPEDDANDKKDCDMAELVTESQAVEVFSAPMVPHPADLPSVFDAPTVSSTTSAQTVAIPSTKDFVKSGSKGFTSPLKKPAAKSASSESTASTVLHNVTTPPPAMPLKRAPEGTLTPPPDAKRLQTETTPLLTPTYLSRPPTTSPNPRPLGVEAKVAEQRKRLEATRKKRAEMAKKKAALDEQMAPYKQRMEEELERLVQENAEEDSMLAEDEHDCQTSEMMLEEFMRADRGGL